MIVVPLTLHEIATAANIGVRRNLSAMYNHRKPAHGAQPNGAKQSWADEIEGACGEMAVCKFLNVFWLNAMRSTTGGDDAGPYQVRTNSYTGGDLRLHKSDDDEKNFILVTGQAPVFSIIGWLRASEGKQEKYWGDKFKTGRPCFWIPQDDLNPLEWLQLFADRFAALENEQSA